MKDVLKGAIVVIVAAAATVAIGVSMAGADNPHPPKPARIVEQCFNSAGQIEATKGAVDHRPTCAHSWDLVLKWDGTPA